MNSIKTFKSYMCKTNIVVPICDSNEAILLEKGEIFFLTDELDFSDVDYIIKTDNLIPKAIYNATDLYNYTEEVDVDLKDLKEKNKF